jgi:hypothetical protein
MRKLFISGLTLYLILTLTGCQKTDLFNPEDQISHIDLQISGLHALGDSAWYECWVMWTEGEEDTLKKYYESIGLVTKNDGYNFWKSVDINMGYVQKMLHLVTTIEQDTVPGYRITITNTTIDSAQGPSRNKIIAAKIVANSGLFEIGNEQILDFDFETAQAHYIIDTPTDTLNTNLKRGIWFVNLDTIFTEIKDTSGIVIGMDTIVEKISGLELPELPAGWFYEGWIIFGNDTVSTGRFINPFGADNSLIYGAGLASGYNFPGEDFINNAPAGVTFPSDLSGSEVLVTITPPYPKNSLKPFTLIPFKVTIPMNCESKKVYSMENNVFSFPSGSLTLTVSLYD